MLFESQVNFTALLIRVWKDLQHLKRKLFSFGSRSSSMSVGRVAARLNTVFAESSLKGGECVSCAWGPATISPIQGIITDATRLALELPILVFFSLQKKLIKA
jgi:hypothetical protein